MASPAKQGSPCGLAAACAGTVGIIGTGGVGIALARSLLRGGAPKVVLGIRGEPGTPAFGAKAKAAMEDAAAAVGGDAAWRVESASVAECCARCDAAILAVTSAHGDGAIDAVANSLDADALKGKPLIDATNPLSSWPALEVRWAEGTSGAEMLQRALPGVHVYKAFNTTGVEHLAAPDGAALGVDPLLASGSEAPRLTMLIAGSEDPAAMGRALAVVCTAGFAPRFVGPLRYARNLEAIAELWIHNAIPGSGPGGGTGGAMGRAWHLQVVGSCCPQEDEASKKQKVEGGEA